MAKSDRSSRASLTFEHVGVFTRVQPQLTDLLEEMRELSKKKPDDPINKFKLAFINDKLREANAILGDDGRPLKSFEEFDAALMPSNSDVVMIVSQYLGSLNRWRSAHTRREGGYTFWDTDPPIQM